MKKMSKYLFIVMVSLFITFISISAPRAQASEFEGSSVEDMVKVIKEIVPEAKVDLDPLSGKLIINAPLSKIIQIKNLLLKMDQAEAQIAIEARFLELEKADEKELAVSLDGLISDYISGSVVGGDPAGWYSTSPDSQSSFQSGFNLKSGEDTTAGLYGGDIVTTGSEEEPAEAVVPGMDFRYTKISSPSFRMLLHALEKNENLNVVYAPKVTTKNGVTASVDFTTDVWFAGDGTTISYVVTSPPGTGVIVYDIEPEKVEIGVKLEVTPEIRGADIIALTLKPEVEIDRGRQKPPVVTLPATSPDGTTTTVDLSIPEAWGTPIVDHRVIETQVLLKSGATLVLGGLITDNDRIFKRKVPILGNIPILGFLFRSTYQTRVKSNLVVFLTAYLVDPTGKKIKTKG
jgi:general secretion pathway protein D